MMFDLQSGESFLSVPPGEEFNFIVGYIRNKNRSAVYVSRRATKVVGQLTHHERSYMSYLRPAVLIDMCKVLFCLPSDRRRKTLL